MMVAWFHESGNLFYLTNVEVNVDKCKQCVCHDVQTWHEISGHCNYEDVQKLQGVVKGMEIKASAVRPAFCVCIHRENLPRRGIGSQTVRLRNPTTSAH